MTFDDDDDDDIVDVDDDTQMIANGVPEKKAA